MNDNYKKKVKNRTIRRCLLTFFPLLFFNVLFSMGCLYLLVFLVITFTPIYYMIYRLRQIKKYELTTGTIKDVNVEDYYGDPYTIAIVSYKVGKETHKTKWDITHFGDYEEGCDELIDKMMEDDKKKYLGKKIPVLYNKDNHNNILMYIEDVEE